MLSPVGISLLWPGMSDKTDNTTHPGCARLVSYNECRSKSSQAYSERRAMTEHFSWRNTLPLLIKREKLIERDGVMPFLRPLAQSETQTTSPRIWTQVAKSISWICKNYNLRMVIQNRWNIRGIGIPRTNQNILREKLYDLDPDPPKKSA